MSLEVYVCWSADNDPLVFDFLKLAHRQIPLEDSSGKDVTFLRPRDIANQALNPRPLLSRHGLLVRCLLDYCHSKKL